MLKKEHAHAGEVKNQCLNMLCSHDFGVWLPVQTGFGFMNGFIGLFDTERDYNLQFTISHTYTH
jgi:hypothetical protein